MTDAAQAALPTATHPVDRHVGLRVRMRRKTLGLSQERLATAVGVTFQQIQKYERGANRVSASMLWEIAEALDVPIGWFYEGLPKRDADAPRDASLDDFLASRQGIELAAAFMGIDEASVRHKLVELARALADD